MKYLAFFGLLLIVLWSCKSDPEEVEGCTDPIATNYNSDATVDNGSCVYSDPEPVSYSLEFLSYSGAGGFDWYKNLLVVINGDTLEGLIGHTTDRITEQIEGDWVDSGTPYPTNGVSYSITLGVNYDILVLDEPTKVLFYEIHGSFEEEPNPTTYDRDIYFDITSDTEYDVAVTSTIGSTASYSGGMGEGNVEDKYFFVPVIQY